MKYSLCIALLLFTVPALACDVQVIEPKTRPEGVPPVSAGMGENGPIPQFWDDLPGIRVEVAPEKSRGKPWCAWDAGIRELVAALCAPPLRPDADPYFACRTVGCAVTIPTVTWDKQGKCVAYGNVQAKRTQRAQDLVQP